METVAYIYFRTPEEANLVKLCEDISLSGLSLTHFGFRDPPKKRLVAPLEMAREILSQPELNKWVFLKDGTKKICITLEIKFDTKWPHSTISMSGECKDTIVCIVRKLSEKTYAFLSFYGVLGGGKDQHWNLIYESEYCPENIKNRVRFA